MPQKDRHLRMREGILSILKDARRAGGALTQSEVGLRTSARDTCVRRGLFRERGAERWELTDAGKQVLFAAEYGQRQQMKADLVDPAGSVLFHRISAELDEAGAQLDSDLDLAESLLCLVAARRDDASAEDGRARLGFWLGVLDEARGFDPRSATPRCTDRTQQAYRNGRRLAAYLAEYPQRMGLRPAEGVDEAVEGLRERVLEAEPLRALA